MRDGLTRKGRVLRDLRAAGSRGFCASHWYIEGRPNDRNAPSELSHDGYTLTSEPCHERDHGDGTYARHYLVEKPTQLALKVA